MLLEAPGDLLEVIFGLSRRPQDLTSGQMGARAILVYLVTLLLIRIGPGRLLGQRSAFDFVMSLIIGSVLSRAINGQAPVGTTIVASVVLFALHWLLSFGSYYWHWLGNLVKGGEVELLRDGKLKRRAMLRNTISERDLLEDLRHNLHKESLDDVAVARLERGGEVSFIEKPRGPRVLEVKVEAGVQTVRIELDG